MTNDRRKPETPVDLTELERALEDHPTSRMRGPTDDELRLIQAEQEGGVIHLPVINWRDR